MQPIDAFSAQKEIADKTCEPSSSGRITVGDIKMYYQVLGQGEPLLMIMGLGGHSLDWGWTLPQRFIQANLAVPGTLEACMGQLEAFMAFDVNERLSTIHAPTMVIIGNRDVLTPPPNSYRIAKAIPGAQLREIDGAGHIFWISHPEETANIVTQFLGCGV